MRAGAFDFLVKPFDADRLNTTVRNALERARLKSDLDVLRDTVGRDRFCGFVGASPAMQGVYRTLEAAAPSNATVFVTGESGTGKELAAEAVHRLSKRADGPFIALNCAAIPADLVESELFGHVKGAFTGAVRDRPGAVAQAEGGTLFLDEICEMQIDLQSKLLRLLQSGTYQPVGGREVRPADIRVVCATNRDPLASVRAGRFREDLYYRLNVLPVHLPPLREREDDVVRIAQSLLVAFAAEEDRRFERLADDAAAALMAHDWPGNVRELQNVLRRAVVLADDVELTAAMLPIAAAPRGMASPSVPPAPATSATADATDPSAWRDIGDVRTLAAVERAAIERAIALCDGNVPRAAGVLGVSPSTLYRKRQAWAAEACPGGDGTR
jgi:two-component system repressor protein LuxO